jgi:hypothetical protein
MKKFLFLLVVAPTMLVGCSMQAVAPKAPTKLTNTATYTPIKVAEPVVAVFADLDVSPNKISFFYMPSGTVVNAGPQNVIDSAIREALIANGNADVLVGLEKQIKYAGDGTIESVTVTGYPAKYVNFRSPGDDYLRQKSLAGAPSAKKGGVTPATGTESSGGMLGKLIGK